VKRGWWWEASSWFCIILTSAKRSEALVVTECPVICVDKGKLVGVLEANIPTYYLSLLPIPVSVALRLLRLQWDFLWSGIGDEVKFHLVNWYTICTPIKVGGLGFRNLIQFNRALLGKWMWRYDLEREALWRLVIEVKYGSLRGGWCSTEVVGTYGMSVWKHIRRGWETFYKFVRFGVGGGYNVRFW
jgi:hypothetical protein